MTKRTKKQTIMREPWVGAIVAFFLFLAADPFQISTLKVQAQVMIMEDGCIFDPVWYCRAEMAVASLMRSETCDSRETEMRYSIREEAA